MTSCAEVRCELVAVLRGEAPDSVAAAVARHVEACASCGAERDAVARTLDAVARHVHPETSADARMRLRSVLDAELAARPRPRPARQGLHLFAVPAAVAAGALLALAAAGIGTDGVRGPATADVEHAAPPQPRGELETRSADAMARGLDWLAAQQAGDGTWGPRDHAGTETREAATAATLLAFAGGGETAHRGPRAGALLRAESRLAELLAAPPSDDAEQKPVYALALSVRALATTYALDRETMDPGSRRDRRALLVDAGRRLVKWQRDDGGFGYVPAAARSDSSCTVFALAALVDLRRAGLLDAGAAVARGVEYLDGLRGADGTLSYSHQGDRVCTSALSAALLALDRAIGSRREPAPGALDRVERAITAGGDALLAWTGTEALVAHGRPLEAPVRGLLAAQRADGAWSSASDDRCREAGDSVTTAFGVLALSAVCAR